MNARDSLLSQKTGRRFGEDGGEGELPDEEVRSFATAMSSGRGAFVHVRHNLRWRARSAGVGGGFIVQFCSQLALLKHPFKASYSAHDSCAALTLSHHVSCALPNLATRRMSRGLKAAGPLTESCLQLPVGVFILVAAVQRVLDELVAVLEEIGAKLSARARQIVQCVQVELAGELPNNAASLTWLAYRHGMELVLARFRLTDNS